jgi:magnesium transporter
VHARIREGRGPVRTSGVDYCAYALLDAVIDGYFPVLEHYGDRLEHLEDEVLARPSQRTMVGLQAIRRELLAFRHDVWHLREALASLLRDGGPHFRAETRVYLRDCYDHLIHVIDLAENYRELAAGSTELYLSSVSNRTNETMKVLTIIATLFIPLTFITGIYGMNFDPAASPWNMPELRAPLGYPAVLGLMAAVAIGLLLYFRRKGWLG